MEKRASNSALKRKMSKTSQKSVSQTSFERQRYAKHIKIRNVPPDIKTTLKKSASTCNVENKQKSHEYFDIDGLDSPEKLEKEFDKIWTKINKERRDASPEPLIKDTEIDTKVMELQNRIKLNCLILDNTKKKMKNIDFKSERENVEKWKHNLFNIKGRDDKIRIGQSLSDMQRAHESEMHTLRQQKPDRLLFLKSCPGISDFHKTLEGTLTMLEKLQKTDTANYDQTMEEFQREIDLNVLHAPANVTTSSDEE